jgi:hypothetical protein
MTYRSSAYPSGVTIDGFPDAGIPVPGEASVLQPPIEWEQATGGAGTLNTVSRVDTNLPGYVPGSFYRDEGSSPTFGQCGGYADSLSYGTSGVEFKSSGANTDPTLGAAYRLTGTRTTFFDGPNEDAAAAARRSEQIDDPLAVTVSDEPEPARPELVVRAGGAQKRVRPGGSVRIPVRVRNGGGSAAIGVEVCARAPKRTAATGRCKGTKLLEAGEGFRAKLRIDARQRARKRIRITLRASADNARRDKAEATIRVRR